MKEDSSHQLRERDVEEFLTPSLARPEAQPVEHGEGEKFDAFLVFSDTSRDVRFMKEMINILEGDEHNIKLFVPGRDFLAGTEKHVLSADMITRCRRVIVILSQGFENSEYTAFVLKLAQSLSPGAKTKRIIPILIDSVKIPLVLNCVGIVDFTDPHLREWAWPRVAAAIKSPLIPSIED